MRVYITLVFEVFFTLYLQIFDLDLVKTTKKIGTNIAFIGVVTN